MQRIESDIRAKCLAIAPRRRNAIDTTVFVEFGFAQNGIVAASIEVDDDASELLTPYIVGQKQRWVFAT